jgi:uncharacterized protein (UPF0303 family)
VTLITNASVDFDTNKIFKKLSDRARVGWSLSFDNIGQRFEYVRHGGSWSLLQKNLDILAPLMASGAHWGGIHAVYNIYNATCLIELTQFARSRDLTIHWQSLYQPECLDPARLGKEIAELATKEIKNLLALDICLDNERQFFQTVLTGLSGADDLRKDLQQHITEIEQKYHTDQLGQFVALWPEIHNIL